jgi:hypothetical protein
MARKVANSKWRPNKVNLSAEETLRRMAEFPERRQKFVAAIRGGRKKATVRKIKSKLTPSEVKNLVFQLPLREFMKLFEAMNERAETLDMMRIAETGFREWNEEGEEIYDEKAPTR